MGISNWVVSNGMNYIVERLPQPNIHNVSYSPTLITKTVGINNTLDDFIVTVPQNRNPNHLTDGEQVRLSYHDNNSGFECSILVNVKIVDDPKAVNADFYLNKATLRRLGLNPDNGLGLYHIEMFSK
ncbi:MAG: hypothetical protein K2G69_01740 [Muribaculaceae bacterium]|nr:hypothetical protein [Muribaculaceae bacterium]